MEGQKILFVDDDPEIREVLRLLLESEGYQVIEATNGEQVLEKLDDSVGLVILDVMMPDMNGYGVCAEIRKRSAVPVLFLTAKSQDSDKTLGFSAGGDDYLVKPFSYSELISRVKAMLRRYYVYGAKQTDLESTIHCCGTVEIDPRQCVVRQEGREVPLTDTEYRILLLLASHPTKVFSVQNIYESVWNEPYFYSSNNTVMVHIRNIRRKLGDDPQNSRTIRTVWGRGYRIE
ncbi:response regulator transcription factor [Lawsonibacter sp. LCP25S3_G6]|uniref:response regulator transcription factor n=1 Tax=unclassified Lawsonibacter TaxID=2617946 RepID=UPI003F9E66E8